MFKTKEIFSSKWKMRKIFTSKTKRPRVLQKMLAVGVSFSLAAAMVPRGKSHFVEAADEQITIPIEYFATPEELIDLCTNTNSGNGLLATGTSNDKVIKINFGERDSDVKYYYSDWSTEYTAEAGSITWLIAGSDEADSVVLYSEKPLQSANAIKYSSNAGTPTADSDNDSRFQTSISDQTYSAPANSGYGSFESSQTVYPNHWGASNLRKQLQTLSGSIFSAEEEGLAPETTIATEDTMYREGGNKVAYTTADVLYAPLSPGNAFGTAATTIAVGDNDNILIDKAYWGGRSWLRSPNPLYDEGALAVLPVAGVYSDHVCNRRAALSAAFRLSLDSVLFASAASAALSAEGSENFSQILPDSPMTLRLNGTGHGGALESAEITAEGATVTYTAPAGSRLMAIVTTNDGATYQYVKDIGTAATDATFDFGSITALSGKNYTAKAWIETDMADGGTLTYATKPVTSVVDSTRPDFWEDTVTWNGVSQRIRLYDDNHVLPADAKFSASLVDTHPDIDHDHPAEHTLSYELLLTDADGNNIQLSAPVRLMFEVVDGLDVNELEIIRVTLGDDVEFDESSVTLDGKKWVQVKTDHFSPYALIDKLTAADKADSKFVKTGDEVTYLTISGLGLIMTLALGLMLTTNFGKRKFND